MSARPRSVSSCWRSASSVGASTKGRSAGCALLSVSIDVPRRSSSGAPGWPLAARARSSSAWACAASAVFRKRVPSASRRVNSMSAISLLNQEVETTTSGTTKQVLTISALLRKPSRRNRRTPGAQGPWWAKKPDEGKDEADTAEPPRGVADIWESSLRDGGRRPDRMSPARLHHRQNCWIRSVDKLGLERVHPQRATVTARTTVIQKRYEALERTDQGLQIGTRLAEARQRYLSARDGLLAARGDDEQVRLRADAFQALTRDYIVAADAMVAWQLQRQKALGA